MTQLMPRSSENVGRLFRHHHRGIFREWAVQCLLRGKTANEVARRNNAMRHASHRVTPRYVAQKAECVAQVIREVDPDDLGLRLLLTRPYHFWSVLKLWRAGFTMQDILVQPRLIVSNRVRGVSWRTITTIRRLAAQKRAA